MTSNEILVIHDDQDISEEIRRIVSTSGFKTHLAKNKSQAIEISSVTTLRTIIINALLADVSIVALITELRKIPHLKDTPIILLAESDGVYNEILALSKDKAAYGTINSIKLPASEEDLVSLIASSAASSSEESTNDNSDENWNSVDLNLSEEKSKIESEDEVEINALKRQDEEFIENVNTDPVSEKEILQEELNSEEFKSEEISLKTEKIEESELLPQIDSEEGITETEQETKPFAQIINDTVPTKKKLIERYDGNIPESIEKTFDSDQLRLSEEVDDSKKTSLFFKNKRVLYIGVIQILFVIAAAVGGYMFFFKDYIKTAIVDNKKAITETAPKDLIPTKPVPEAPVVVLEQIGAKDLLAKKQDETVTKGSVVPKDSVLNQGTNNKPADKSAADKSAADKAAADKAAANKVAADKAAADKVAADKAAADKAAADKAAADKAAANKVAADKAAANKVAADKVAADKVAADKAAADKAAANKVAADKAVANKVAADKAAADKAAADKAAAIKAVSDKAAKEKDLKEKNSSKKTVSEKTVIEKPVKEKIEPKKIVTENPAQVKQAKKSETKPASSEQESNYSAQVGMFKESSNAENIVTKIKGFGYQNVIIKEEKRTKGTVYRVLVGPYEDSEGAANIVNQLKSVGVDSYIYKY
ncbi:MAG: SPOR domain-containing protein [Nitrospirae bacterium]|nr:SPOR domain-containing protein [Nitrospirota bacterium]MBF0540928.1 SPOR domain-containing protein [Nitrospirota bacterium]